MILRKPTEGVASLCVTCRFADWKKTANGRRHPDGSGKCTYELPDGPLPKWMRERLYGRDIEFITSLRPLLEQRFPLRFIYRKDFNRTVAEPCATWVQE